MQITNITTHEGRGLVPIKGWGNVGKVLTAYANGNARGSRGTTRKLLEEVETAHGDNGGMAAGMVMLSSIQMGSPSRLVNDLLQEAEKKLKERPEFEKSYDYDGMGTPFFKTSVKIRTLPGEFEMYGIGLWAAYVGDEPEIGLADYLQIPRTLFSGSVEVQTERFPGDRFEFDFEPVIQKLSKVLSFMKSDTLGKVPTGTDVAQAMLKMEDGESKAVFMLQDQNALEVRIFPGCVDRRMQMDRTAHKVKDTWSVSGSRFSGLLKRDYKSDDESVKTNPTFIISVSSSDKDRWRGSQPIWKPEKQQEAIALMKSIAGAMKN